MIDLEETLQSDIKDELICYELNCGHDYLAKKIARHLIYRGYSKALTAPPQVDVEGLKKRYSDLIEMNERGRFYINGYNKAIDHLVEKGLLRSGWQPIETADYYTVDAIVVYCSLHKEVLLYRNNCLESLDGHETCDMDFSDCDDGDKIWYVKDCDGEIVHHISYWQPLPEGKE